jgi:hypothetical protein
MEAFSRLLLSALAWMLDLEESGWTSAATSVEGACKQAVALHGGMGERTIGSASEIFLGAINVGLGGVGSKLLLDLVAEGLAVGVRHFERSLSWIELICRLQVVV